MNFDEKGGCKMDIEERMNIYDEEQICESCVEAPDSKDNYEWLQAAIGKKYVEGQITYEYIDINEPPEDKKHKEFVEKIFEEDLFYPVVLINDEIVAEGIPQLKTIYKELDQYN